jgi:hypothetical protein
LVFILALLLVRGVRGWGVAAILNARAVPIQKPECFQGAAFCP